MRECIARALVFSGRPDPTWKIEKSALQALEQIWESTVPTQKEVPFTPPLGYRGCIIKCDSESEWFVYKNVVTLKKGSITESREDRYRKFEEFVLSSAPEGLLPPTLVENKK